MFLSPEAGKALLPALRAPQLATSDLGYVLSGIWNSVPWLTEWPLNLQLQSLYLLPNAS